MKRRKFIVAMAALPLLNRMGWASSALSDEEKKPAFEVGEKLKYSLGWQFIVAGHATTEVLPDTELDGRMIRNFKLTAKTTHFADAFYKVRDTLTSSAEYDVSRSLGYSKKQREGDTERDETIVFDWENLEAHYHEALKDKRRTISILENTLDPLSAFYFVRNQDFDVGSVIEGPMTDGKRCKMAQIRVVKREKIKVNGHRYQTFKMIPDIKDVGGVFKKSKNASMEIWCTADHRHIPVLMKSKVVVGSFRAELVVD